MEIEDIKDKYHELTNPVNFVSTFDTEQEFIQWCEDGTISDLWETLKAFEEAELYEHCAIINKVRQDKTQALINQFNEEDEKRTARGKTRL